MRDIDINGFLGDKIGAWIANHRNRHATLFNVILDLNQECHDFLSGRQVDSSNTLHITAATLFARLLELFQGIVITVEHGMVSVGRVLSRAHLEAFFKLMAIHEDPTFLQQYLDYRQWDRKHLVNRILNANDPSLATLRGELDADLPQKIAETITQQDIHRLSTEEIARRAGLHARYATAYAILSGAVHTAAQDLESHLDYDGERQELQGFVYGPSESETARLLCIAGSDMAEALKTTSTIFGENRAELCTRFMNQFERLCEMKRSD